jgi:ABC-2 type transport system permease protein
MKELLILLAPVTWSLKNTILRFHRSFYRKAMLYIASSGIFIVLMTKLLNMGMAKLQSLSSEVFYILLLKGYSLIFIIIFFIQIINGLMISLNTFYQSRELEVLFVSPVNRTSLFYSRLFETHVRASWMLIIFGIPVLVSPGLLYHANLSYYVSSFVLFIAFSIIPVNIGIAITMFFSGIFHAGKLKKLLFSTGVVVVILLVTLLRIFRPERFVNPDLFANLTLFISEMRAPSFILLPNRWLSESVFHLLSKTLSSNILIFISLLFLTSYVTIVFLQIVFRRYHYRGWELLQEGGIPFKGRVLRPLQVMPGAEKSILLKFLERFTHGLDTQSRMFLKKDFLYQIRDVKNIHQILILLSLIIVYLFSVSSLPLNWEYYAVQLKYIVSFFNLGLILIIIASLCSRIVYPAVVSEGNSLWVIKTSTITPKRYVWTKFLFFFIPMFVFVQLLTLSSSMLIGIGKAFIMLEIITATFLSFPLVIMAISFGISGLRHEVADTQEQIRTGSTAYMLLSVFLILFTLILEIIPSFLYFLKESKKGVFTQEAWIAIGLVISLLFLLSLVITAFSVRLSIKKIDNLQLS